MAAISIFALTTFFSNEPKSISRGENHYKSGHIESFSYSDGVLRGSVYASMKNKSYKVTVYKYRHKTRSYRRVYILIMETKFVPPNANAPEEPTN
ncbi:hypothetical protein QZH41_011024 [Actinostola sp. cb2023]|nr:hypothetical protein QZH41_011024 [Actinostola sp. cb2023]